MQRSASISTFISVLNERVRDTLKDTPMPATFMNEPNQEAVEVMIRILRTNALLPELPR